MNYELITEKMNEMCETYIGHTVSKNEIYFDFNTDDECYIHVSNMHLMEDENNILEDAKAVFEEIGLKAEFEWDYDCGDEYSQSCMLEIKILDTMTKDEKFKLIDDLEEMACGLDIADEDMEELGNQLRNLRLTIEFESGDISEDEFLEIRECDF